METNGSNGGTVDTDWIDRELERRIPQPIRQTHWWMRRVEGPFHRLDLSKVDPGAPPCAEIDALLQRVRLRDADLGSAVNSIVLQVRSQLDPSDESMAPRTVEYYKRWVISVARPKYGNFLKEVWVEILEHTIPSRDVLTELLVFLERFEQSVAENLAIWGHFDNKYDRSGAFFVDRLEDACYDFEYSSGHFDDKSEKIGALFHRHVVAPLIENLEDVGVAQKDSHDTGLFLRPTEEEPPPLELSLSFVQEIVLEDVLMREEGDVVSLTPEQMEQLTDHMRAFALGGPRDEASLTEEARRFIIHDFLGGVEYTVWESSLINEAQVEEVVELFVVRSTPNYGGNGQVSERVGPERQKVETLTKRLRKWMPKARKAKESYITRIDELEPLADRLSELEEGFKKIEKQLTGKSDVGKLVKGYIEVAQIDVTPDFNLLDALQLKGGRLAFGKGKSFIGKMKSMAGRAFSPLVSVARDLDGVVRRHAGPVVGEFDSLRAAYEELEDYRSAESEDGAIQALEQLFAQASELFTEVDTAMDSYHESLNSVGNTLSRLQKQEQAIFAGIDDRMVDLIQASPGGPTEVFMMLLHVVGAEEDSESVTSIFMNPQFQAVSQKALTMGPKSLTEEEAALLDQFSEGDFMMNLVDSMDKICSGFLTVSTILKVMGLKRSKEILLGSTPELKGNPLALDFEKVLRKSNFQLPPGFSL